MATYDGDERCIKGKFDPADQSAEKTDQSECVEPTHLIRLSCPCCGRHFLFLCENIEHLFAHESYFSHICTLLYYILSNALAGLGHRAAEAFRPEPHNDSRNGALSKTLFIVVTAPILQTGSDLGGPVHDFVHVAMIAAFLGG